MATYSKAFSRIGRAKRHAYRQRVAAKRAAQRKGTINESQIFPEYDPDLQSWASAHRIDGTVTPALRQLLPGHCGHVSP